MLKKNNEKESQPTFNALTLKSPYSLL